MARLIAEEVNTLQPQQQAQSGAPVVVNAVRSVSASTSASADADGFKVARRKGGRSRKSGTDPTGHVLPQTGPPQERRASGGSLQPTAQDVDMRTQNGTMLPPVLHPVTLKGATHAGGGSSRPAKQTRQSFAKFKRDKALGRFEVLADDADADSDEDSDEGQEEAPYAYSGSPQTRVATPQVTAADPKGVRVQLQGVPEAPTSAQSGNSKGQAAAPTLLSAAVQERTSGPSGVSVTGPSEDIDINAEMDTDADMLSDEVSVVSGYVGSSAPSSTQSPALTPGSEFPFSLDSDLNGDMLHHTGQDLDDAAPDGDQERSTDASVLYGESETPMDTTPSLSQDGFCIERTAPAPGMPQQLPSFLLPFRGSLTEVPANGQCAYAALYAPTTATTETKLTFTSDVVRGANVIERSVYTLMMTNLSNDVECNVVDPRRELQRLYPTQPAPTETAVATAALYKHYTQERGRTVNTHIPSEFWAG
ncbi:hypothetical protein PR002_g21270 [Phytophthora rubi]|uniref:Uncharacterized protein n=1 Tax=Phytophthora rubi TaxID=129364 RepID=A0A6A3J428_9STRA|nr:hypothetical protein PR002_g21270 [Phytophthora rubi]